MQNDYEAGAHRSPLPERPRGANPTSNEVGVDLSGRIGDAIRPIRALLAPRDVHLLTQYLRELDQPGADWSSPVAELLHAKFMDAKITSCAALPSDVATGGSRVMFALNGGHADTRLLHHGPDLPMGCGVPVRTLLGATLLGMRAGDTAPVPLRDGSIATVHLVAVPYQPEAAGFISG